MDPPTAAVPSWGRDPHIGSQGGGPAHWGSRGRDTHIGSQGAIPISAAIDNCSRLFWNFRPPPPPHSLFQFVTYPSLPIPICQVPQHPGAVPSPLIPNVRVHRPPAAMCGSLPRDSMAAVGRVMPFEAQAVGPSPVTERVYGRSTYDTSQRCRYLSSDGTAAGRASIPPVLHLHDVAGAISCYFFGGGRLRSKAEITSWSPNFP